MFDPMRRQTHVMKGSCHFARYRYIFLFSGKILMREKVINYLQEEADQNPKKMTIEDLKTRRGSWDCLLDEKEQRILVSNNFVGLVRHISRKKHHTVSTASSIIRLGSNNSFTSFFSVQKSKKGNIGDKIGTLILFKILVLVKEHALTVLNPLGVRITEPTIQKTRILTQPSY